MPLHRVDDLSRVVLVGDDVLIYYSCGYLELRGEVGDLVSLVPLRGEPIITLSGFAYPLDQHRAQLGDSRTLRNRLTRPQSTIRHQGGTLIVFHYPKSKDLR